MFLKGLAEDIGKWKSDTSDEIENLKKDVGNILEGVQFSSKRNDKVVKEIKVLFTEINIHI